MTLADTVNWFRLPVILMIIIRENDRVLLSRRANTGFKDGFFALPGGKHDGHETLTHGVIREAQEELGIFCTSDQVHFRSLLHTQLNQPAMELLYAVFEVTEYTGEIINNEPHKCAELQFFPVDQLPEKMTEVSRRCILNTVSGVNFDEVGWLEPVD